MRIASGGVGVPVPRPKTSATRRPAVLYRRGFKTTASASAQTLQQHLNRIELCGLTFRQPYLGPGHQPGSARDSKQANPGVARNALRPYKGYGEILEYINGSHENYNSLQARMQTRFSKGGLVTLSYTWSQNWPMVPHITTSRRDSTILSGDYGPANYTQPKIFVASYVYPLPVLAARACFVQGDTRRLAGLGHHPHRQRSARSTSFSPRACRSRVTWSTTSSVAQRPNLDWQPLSPWSRASST